MRQAGKIFGLLLLLCQPVLAQAENFVIQNYDVSLEVTRNRQVYVQENIKVEFTQDSHGIIRSIPLGSSDVSYIKVSSPFHTYSLGNMVEIKIGSAAEYVSGVQTYNISYLHQIYDNKPEFYYNLVGPKWGVPIKKVRFRVHMPDKVDANFVGLSIGEFGTKGFEGGAEFKVDEDVIFGETFRELRPDEGVTLRLEVPPNYFFNTVNQKANLVWIGLLLCTMFSFLIWYSRGKDDHVTPVITFNPPPEINCVDAELIMNESVTDKGLIALMIKLAYDGFLKLTPQDKEYLLSDFKPYTGDNETENSLLSTLKKQAGGSGKITVSQLQHSVDFYDKWSFLRETANEEAIRKRFYDVRSMNKKYSLSLLFLVIVNALLTLYSGFNYHFSWHSLLIYGPLPLVAIVCYGVFFRSDFIMRLRVIFMITLILIPLVQPFLEGVKANWFQFGCGVFCVLFSFVCFNEILKPNALGRFYKKQLLGLKQFIEVAEKKRLEALVGENPQYFSKILPYAYILGVSDIWIKQFEKIAMPRQKLDIRNRRQFKHLMRQFRFRSSGYYGGSSQYSTTRTKSGGFGGFVGGGFGGGGGRSW